MERTVLTKRHSARNSSDKPPDDDRLVRSSEASSGASNGSSDHVNIMSGEHAFLSGEARQKGSHQKATEKGPDQEDSDGQRSKGVPLLI